jgi:hypothetical protein
MLFVAAPSTAQPLFAACVVAPQLRRGRTFPPSPRPQRRRRAPRTPARASAARCSQGAATQRPAPRLPPRPPPRSLGRGSRRRAPTSRGFRYQLASLSAESEANCFASATSGMTGAPLPLVAVRLVARGKRAGAARFPSPRRARSPSARAPPLRAPSAAPPPAPPAAEGALRGPALPPTRRSAHVRRTRGPAPAHPPRALSSAAHRLRGPPAPAPRLPPGNASPPRNVASQPPLRAPVARSRAAENPEPARRLRPPLAGWTCGSAFRICSSQQLPRSSEPARDDHLNVLHDYLNWR